MSDKNRPNVIICLCDQLRAFALGCYGNEFVQTPNIDAMAGDGVRFVTACSNDPVCSPSRSSIISGQYNRTCTGKLSNHNVHPPLQDRKMLLDPTIAEVFKDAGYDTALIGKWHIEPHPNVVGFDYALYPFYSHRNTGQTFYENGDEEGFVPDEFAPDFESKQMAKYLKEHKDNPFFLYYNISPPHMPLDDAPEKYKTMYSPSEVPLRENVDLEGKLAHDERWFKIYMWDFLFYTHHLPYTESLPENFGIRELTALYYGLTSWVDDLVGNMLRELKANGLLDNTLIVFTSDHGDNLGSHHLFNKNHLIEEAIRIPMVLHCPSMLEPTVKDKQIASIVDVMPTILGLTGLDIPDSVQGTDLSPVVRGEQETVGENVAYIENQGNEIGIRTPNYLYGMKVHHQKKAEEKVFEEVPGEHLFYDVVNDPYEMHNLAFSDTHVDIKTDLRERLVRWNKDTPVLQR